MGVSDWRGLSARPIIRYGTVPGATKNHYRQNITGFRPSLDATLAHTALLKLRCASSFIRQSFLPAPSKKTVSVIIAAIATKVLQSCRYCRLLITANTTNTILTILSAAPIPPPAPATTRQVSIAVVQVVARQVSTVAPVA